MKQLCCLIGVSLILSGFELFAEGDELLRTNELPEAVAVQAGGKTPAVNQQSKGEANGWEEDTPKHVSSPPGENRVATVPNQAASEIHAKEDPKEQKPHEHEHMPRLVVIEEGPGVIDPLDMMMGMKGAAPFPTLADLLMGGAPADPMSMISGLRISGGVPSIASAISGMMSDAAENRRSEQIISEPMVMSGVVRISDDGRGPRIQASSSGPQGGLAGLFANMMMNSMVNEAVGQHDAHHVHAVPEDPSPIGEMISDMMAGMAMEQALRDGPHAHGMESILEGRKRTHDSDAEDEAAAEAMANAMMGDIMEMIDPDIAGPPTDRSRLTTQPVKVPDMTPPQCVVTQSSMNEVCKSHGSSDSCADSSWDATVLFTSKTIGLSEVTYAELGGPVAWQLSEPNIKSISGVNVTARAKGSCCVLKATIVVTDKFGMIARCSVDQGSLSASASSDGVSKSGSGWMGAELAIKLALLICSLVALAFAIAAFVNNRQKMQASDKKGLIENESLP